MTRLSRGSWIALFALALAARLAVLPWTLPRYEWGRAYPDTLQYEAMARNDRAGNGLVVGPGAVAVRPPLYPLFLSSIQRVFGEGKGFVLATILAQCLLGAWTCALSGDLAACLFGRIPGLLAGITVSLHPELVLYTSLLLTETLAVFLVVKALWMSALIRGSTQDPLETITASLAAGGFCGLAALTRPSLLLLPFGLSAWLAFSALPRRRGLLAASCCLAAAAVSVLPWTLRNHDRLGAWVPVTTKAGWDLYEQFCGEATGGPIYETIRWPAEALSLGEVEADRALRHQAWEWARAHPARSLEFSGLRLSRLWNPLPNDPAHRTPWVMALALSVNVPLFVLALLGSARSLRSDHRSWLLAALPALILTGVHAIFMGSVRYRAPALPGLAVLAAASLAPRRRAP